ncbi:MAG TPA: tetratricopeptide repeat protein [Terriglobales bacterium]|nr:tetratricopeptide repeat protein [Terriglobales bacterium]
MSAAFRLAFFVFLLGCVCLGQTNSSPRAVITPAFRPSDPLNAVAYEHFYNLEYPRAVENFQQIVQRHPDDPFAVNHLLTAVLMRELYRMGAMNSGDYANNSFIGDAHHPADPKVKEQISKLVDRAETLEDARLKANPKDVDALYARGVTRANLSLYTALVERAWFSALRNAVGARRDHERVLELDPHYTDAKLVVGTHLYVLGSLPWSVKAAVAMVGLSGSKEKGIRYLEDAANSNGESSVDAKIVLALFLRREQRYQESLQIIRSLAATYPRNLLFALEEGNLLRAQGHNAEAAAVYKRVFEAGREGRYPSLHYELAALSLGDVLRSQKDYRGAVAAYLDVESVKDADPEYRQRAAIAAGQVYDSLSNRTYAVKEYQSVIAVDPKSPQADAARKCLQNPCPDH